MVIWNIEGLAPPLFYSEDSLFSDSIHQKYWPKVMFKGDLVFLGGENFHPKQITDQQWRDLHHHFIDISSGNRTDLVSVRDEPAERDRFQKAL